MQNFIDEFTEMHDLIDLLYMSGMTDPEKYPTVYKYWSIAKRNDYFQPLMYYLNQYPSILKAAIKRTRSNPFMPMPNSNEINQIQGSINIGIVNYNKDFAGLNPMDTTRGFFICGEIGSGKSYPVLRMLDKILSIPIEERGYNVLIIQVLKRDADYLIKSHPTMKIIEWEHLKRNIFEVESWDNAETKLNYSSSIFAATNYFLSKTQPILNESIIAAKKNNPQICFGDLFQTVVSVIRKLGLIGHEAKNLSDTVRSRLYEFKNRPQLNTRYGFQIEDFFSKEDVILNVIEETNEYVYSTLITDLLISLQRYYNAHPITPKRLRTLIVIDECRSIFPVKKNAFDHNADRFMEQFITTRRSSGIGLVAITQEPQSVSPWLLNNSAFFLAFPLSGTALEDAQKYQNLTDDQLRYFDKLPPYGVGIMRDRRFERPYVLQVPGDINPSDLQSGESDIYMAKFLDDYKRTMQRRESQEMQKSMSAENQDPKTNEKYKQLTRAFMGALKQNYLSKSFEHVDEVFKKLHISEKYQKKILQCLVENNLIIIKNLRHTSRIPKDFPIVTAEGMLQLEIPKSKQINPDHFRHTYYCERLKAWLEHKGLKPIREHKITNKTIEGQMIDGRIDVYVETAEKLEVAQNVPIKGRLACEITMTTTAQDINPNIRKNLEEIRNNNLDLILIICERADDRNKAQQKVEESKAFLKKQLSKVIFTTMDKFLGKIS